MSLIKRKKLNYSLIDDAPPQDKLTSEGDLLIKKLVEKQRCTTTSLVEQLNNPKTFIKGTEVIPLSHYNSGTASLSDVIASTQHFNSIEYLKAAGLNDLEVELYLDNLNGFEYVREKHKNWEKVLLKEHLQFLQGLVEKHEESLRLVPKQHESKYKFVEQGLTVKPESVKTKLLKFALHNNTECQSTLPQAIDNIIEIEKNLFNNLNEKPLPSVNTIRRKARKLQNRLNNLKQESQKEIDTILPQSNSGWDVQRDNRTYQLPETVEKKMHTCSPINYYTIRNNEIIKLTNHKQTLQTIGKLSLEEIKKIPKFKDYLPGNPSKVLYLKNLNNNVKEDDLKQLFEKYNSSITEYKLMRGKLRGQAFITFSSEEKAYQALNELNGTIIKNKPLIIHFSLKR